MEPFPEGVFADTTAKAIINGNEDRFIGKNESNLWKETAEEMELMIFGQKKQNHLFIFLNNSVARIPLSRK